MSNSPQQHGPIVLCVLDGWGLSPTWRGNAIAYSNPPVMERLWREYPHTVLQAFQPPLQTLRHQIGNSEVGHAMIGAGRVLASDLEEITGAIQSKVFYSNPVLLEALRIAIQQRRRVHLIGLASNGGIHSDLTHLEALITMAHQLKVSEVILHLITDGRDTPPTSGPRFVQMIESLIERNRLGRIGTLVGRNLAMDRDERWDQTLIAYRLWVEGSGSLAVSPKEALENAYHKGLTDGEIGPTILAPAKEVTVQDGDVVIVWNVRPDRIRQLVRAFVDPHALRSVVKRQAPLRRLGQLVTLTSPKLSPQLRFEIAFPPAHIPVTLPEIIAGRGLKQLRVSESEKSAHVSYFFNGGRDVPFPGEERLIIPSPRVKRIDQKPGGATELLVQKLTGRLRREHFDFVLLNIANVDLVGHTGNLFATAEAIRIADRAVGIIVEDVTRLQGSVIVTADHGNAEQMLTLPGSQPDQSHTINPVPFILVDPSRKRNLIQQAVTSPPSLLADLVRSKATLADIAPTVLELLGIPIPIEMTGQSLLNQLH